MKKILISISGGFIVGVILTGAIAYYITAESQNISKEVTIKQIEGEKIEHTDYKFKGKTIKFKTVSAGKGVIETEIPKENIPEVSNWNRRVHGLGLNVSCLYYNKVLFMYGLSYEYRWKNVSFNASFLMGSPNSENNIVQIIGGVKYWCKF